MLEQPLLPLPRALKEFWPSNPVTVSEKPSVPRGLHTGTWDSSLTPRVTASKCAKGTGSAATLKSLTFCKKEPKTDWRGEWRKQSFSQKVVFGGELEISEYMFLNKRAFKNSNKHHLSSRDHRLCTQLPLKDQTFCWRQNKESINERCAREVLKSPVLSAAGCSGQVQIQNSKSLGCSTAQSVRGAIPALSSGQEQWCVWHGFITSIYSHFICLQPIFRGIFVVVFFN